MATVRITQSLLEDVRFCTQRYATAERNALPPRPSDADIISRIRARDVEDHIWGEHRHLRDVIPKEWMNSTKHIHINVVINEVPYSFSLQSSNGFCTPPNISEYSYRITVPYESTMLERARPVLDEYVAFFKADKEINAKWLATYHKVREFLESQKSLNAALKTWPGLEMYIPRGYMDKVNEKVQRTKSVSVAEPEVPLTKDVMEELEGLGAVGRIMAAEKF